MSFLTDATVAMIIIAGTGEGMSAATDSERPERVRVQWDDMCGSEQEWAAIARSAPSSDRIREIAEYLLETGQAAI